LEVPSIRLMRELEPAGAEPTETKSTWSMRKGLVFLGSVIFAAAAAYAGFVFWSKPRSVDRAEVLHEIQSRPASENYRLLQSAIAAYSDPIYRRYKSEEEIPFFLLPSAQIIVQFEGIDPRTGNYMPIAPRAYSELVPKVATYEARKAWLPVAVVVGIIGLLVAGSSLLVPPAGKRPAKAAPSRGGSRSKALR
jgi:hypothetical protein